ncbi:MAG: InlB B-repeat-containing protein, partial [Bacteroidales bacterium]|nr:InlB B-repeat-containing protein [Bacteroidales bacterium]
ITINVYNGAALTSITVGEAVEPSAVIDFESDEIGTAYPGIAWNDTNFTATIEASPTDGKSLHFVSNNWNSYPKFAVSLPNDLTLGDIEKITFNLYFTDGGSADQNSWKKFHVFVGETGASFTANEPTQETGNIVGSDARNTWLAKEIVLNITNEALLGLSVFDMGLGELVENADYYLDDISFVPKVVAPIPDTFDVTFDVQGGSAVEAQRVVEGDMAVKPADPTKEDYIFTGWYTAATGGDEYLFNSPVTTDITLYAQWEEDNAAVEKLMNVSNIKVYPSPTKGVVNIENNKGEVSVYSVTGRLIMRTLGSKVDLSAQPDGSYILKIGNNTVKVVKKQ